MANKKRETNAEKAARERQERIELLKMKQGLIEESELIPDTGYAEISVPRGGKKITNFIYRNKPFIVIAAVLVIVIAVGIYQFLTREKVDLYVLAVSKTEDSEIIWRARDLEQALELYCPDFDGNGKVNVEVDYLNLKFEEVNNQMQGTEMQKFRSHLSLGRAQLFISEDVFADYVYENQYTDNFFIRKPDDCPEDILRNEVGVCMNLTDFAKDAHWEDCPDNVVFMVRNELNNGQGSVKANAENRERALIVLQNILDNNIINPPEATSE